VTRQGPGTTPVKWAVRQPEGYYDAVQATGTMVAPILAGFAFAILALVLIPPGRGDTDPLRWRDPVLALLVLSALLLIISTQSAIRARGTMVKPDELVAWYPSSVDDGHPNEWLVERQRILEERTWRASTACRHTYNAGTLLLFTAIAVLLVPSGNVDGARGVTLIAATLAVTLEAAWLTGTSIRQFNWAERLPTLAAPFGYSVAAATTSWVSSTGFSRVAAAAGMAISGTAAATAGIRMIRAGTDRCARHIGFGVLAAFVGSATAAGLLLGGWGHAKLVASFVTAALILVLIAAVRPDDLVTGPDD
jgi:hypothetical protein